MKIRICCNVFVVEDCKDSSVSKSNKKKLKVLVEKGTSNSLNIIFDEKNDINTQLRKKLKEVLGTNFFHLEQAYTLGDSEFFEDGFIDIVYIAITSYSNITNMSDNYEFVDFNVEYRKSITIRNNEYRYTTKAKLIENNTEYYHIVNCEDIKLRKELLKFIISFKFLRGRIKNTYVIFYLLEKYFILEDVRLVYELITDEKVDKSNFRKKYARYCKKTNERIKNKSFRPAELYVCNVDEMEKIFR